jgi:hypothetical protein
MPARISIIIPTFNRPAKLKRALNSCLQQTMPPFEVLVVDNGENPQTKPIVDALAPQAEFNLRYLRSEKFAHRAALGTGINAATGEWLTLLDDDDFLVPDRIARDSELLKEIDPKVNLIIQDFIRVDYQNKLIWQHSMAHKTLGLYEALTINDFPPQAAVTFRTDSIQAHHCFHLKEGWMTEFDLYANLRPHGELLRSGHVGYIMDDTRTSGRVTGSDIQKHIQAVELHRERFRGQRAQLPTEQAQSVDLRLDQQQAFFCAKVLRFKSFFGESAPYCRAHPKESLKGILAPLRGLVSKYFAAFMPEMRGSKTYSLTKFSLTEPELHQLIIDSKIEE